MRHKIIAQGPLASIFTNPAYPVTLVFDFKLMPTGELKLLEVDDGVSSSLLPGLQDKLWEYFHYITDGAPISLLLDLELHKSMFQENDEKKLKKQLDEFYTVKTLRRFDGEVFYSPENGFASQDFSKEGERRAGLV